MFRFSDLTNGGNAVSLSARLVTREDGLSLWLDEEATDSLPLIDGEFSQALCAIVVEHERIWGGWEDIDGDGGVAVLITSRFNASGAAIGLFNPADFYRREDDPESAGYNSASNEMDIIYLACPDASGTEAAFSPQSLLATVAHELTHLANFSHVYRQQLASGAASPVMEPVFLEEGLAHLAESLAGYGRSGGNLAFVARYLEATGSTALAELTTLASGGDSVERRGGMALFLSWCFWEAGGMELSGGEWTDRGGISLLHSLHGSRRRGWEKLEAVLGSPRAELLLAFSRALAFAEPWGDADDPRSGEPVTIHPYYGPVEVFGTEYRLDGPARSDFLTSFSVAPYAIAFGLPFIWEENARLSDSADSTQAGAYLILHHE